MTVCKSSVAMGYPSSKSYPSSVKPETKNEDVKDEIVNVWCAGMNKAFQVSKRLLGNSCANLKNIIKKGPTGADGNVEIEPGLDAAGFEIFRRWLYGGKIWQKDDNLGRLEELLALMEAHDLGATLTTSSFQDFVIDDIISLLLEFGHSFTLSKVIPQKARDLHGKNSALQQLLADWIVYGEFDEQRTNSDQIPRDKDFNRMLVESFIERKVKGCPAAPYMWDRCRYHKHRNTTSCSKKAKISGRK